MAVSLRFERFAALFCGFLHEISEAESERNLLDIIFQNIF